MIKYPIVIFDNVLPLIYDKEFKAFANMHSKDLVDFIINLCKLNIECDRYHLINGEITTFYEDDKLMITDLVFELNDNTFLNIELNTSKSKYLMYKNLLYIYKIILSKQNKGKKCNKNNEYNVIEEGIRFLRMLSSRSKTLNRYLAGDNLFLKKVAKFVEDYSNKSENLLYYDKKELDDYIKESELEDSYSSVRRQKSWIVRRRK